MTDSASQSLVERLKQQSLNRAGKFGAGSYVATVEWQAAIRITKLGAERDRLASELDASNNNHRTMAHQMAELGARCKHAESELSRVEVERNEFRAALKGLSDMYGSTWDRVDGALMMMDSGVKRFEKAHAIAYKLLQRLPASPPPQPINAPNTERKRMSTPPFNVNTGD